MEEPQNIIDISLKALIRRQPNALLRLVGMEVDLGLLRIEDANINNPELHADNVLILDAPEIPEPFAIYLEYQLQPKPDLLATWFTKCGGLTKQLGLPVLLLVVYVTKGNYATFPGRYLVTRGPLTTNFDFTVIKLWEHASQIASGMFPELAPLLVLCEDTPTEATVAREVALIRQSQLPAEIQSELLAIALSIATRSFSRAVLETLFREELPMLRDVPIIGDWIAEAEDKARAEIRQELEETGVVSAWIAEAEIKSKRETTLHILTKRLGALPNDLVERIQKADATWCEKAIDRALEVESVTELHWEELA